MILAEEKSSYRRTELNPLHIASQDGEEQTPFETEIPSFPDCHRPRGLRRSCTERATDAGLRGSRAAPEKRRPQILLDWNGMERCCRECIRRFHQAFGVMTMESEHVSIGQSEDAIELTLAAQGVQQFEESLLALAADGVVNVFRVQSCVCINGRGKYLPTRLELSVATYERPGSSPSLTPSADRA